MFVANTAKPPTPSPGMPSAASLMMVLATLAMVGITHNAATNTLELCRAACGVFMIPLDSTELVVDSDYIACVLLRLICFGMVLVNDAA